MHRTYTRIPAHFFRISLHAGMDQMTLALVPDQEHAHLIAHLLTENYGLRKGESIVVHPTIIRPVDSNESPCIEISLGESAADSTQVVSSHPQIISRPIPESG